MKISSSYEDALAKDLVPSTFENKKQRYNREPKFPEREVVY